MTRSELVKRLTDDNPDLPAATARCVVDAILSTMMDGLAEGRRIELRGFGAFWVKQIAPREARNPKTGDTIQTTGTSAIRFRIGKRLHDRLNPRQERS